MWQDIDQHYSVWRSCRSGVSLRVGSTWVKPLVKRFYSGTPYPQRHPWSACPPYAKMLVYVLPHTTTQARQTSRSTPTPTPYSDPTPCVTNPTIFSPLSTPTYIFTKGFTQAQPTHHRHPHANTVFGFPFSRSLPHDFYASLPPF